MDGDRGKHMLDKDQPSRVREKASLPSLGALHHTINNMVEVTRVTLLRANRDTQIDEWKGATV